MRRHVSVEVLALYREGAVRPRKAVWIASHLSGCSRCTDVVGDLANVSALLTATQLPPMPDVLVVRIEAVIASESALRAASSSPGHATRAQEADAPAAGTTDASTAGAGGPQHIPGRPDLPERSRRGVRRFRLPSLSSPVLLRALAATGAVVILAGGGFLLAKGQTGAESSAGSASGTSHRASAPRPSVNNAPAAHKSASSAPTYVDYRLKGKVVATNAIVTHTNFTRASLPAQVRRDVRSSSVLARGFAGAQRAVPAPTSARIGGVSVSELAGCLDRIAAGRKVLLANIARYLGSPATIIVLKSLTAPDVFDVTIVGLACSSSNTDVISTATVPAG